MKITVQHTRPAGAPRPLIRFDVMGSGIGVWIDCKATGTGMDVKVDRYGKVIVTRSKLGLPTLYVTPINVALPMALWITTDRRV